MRVPLRVPVAAIAGAVVLAIAPAARAGEASGPPPSKATQQKRPPMPCMLPDLVAATLTVELLSSTKGQPGVEFPADRLRVTATIKDAGAKSPASFTARLIRGSGPPVASKTIPAPTSPGQVWTLVKEVTWSHDQPASFLFKVESGFDECTKGNNILAINLDDAKLHANGKQTAADPSIGGTINTGPVVIMF